MQEDEGRFGCEKAEAPKTIMIDYGGPNVAKPLHVGHLRSAIIGESVKRIGQFVGHKVTGDVHLGDWGLQMGLIITELKQRKTGSGRTLMRAYDRRISERRRRLQFRELEEIYPTASKKVQKRMRRTRKQPCRQLICCSTDTEDYQAFLQHILNVSVTDLKRNYANLNVSFDLWKGESDAQPYIPDMVQKLKDEGFAYISDGALVVDVKEDTDTKEIPPCMILKSDGASLYNTTDLATMVWSEEDYDPDEIIYVVDKRQELHFVQVFRCARKTGIVKPETELKFLGFGTMNGKDGKTI